MGLDSVELVMAVEEHFGIAIPDKDASTLITVGKLHNWVVNELHRLNRPSVAETAVFDELFLVSRSVATPRSVSTSPQVKPVNSEARAPVLMANRTNG
jgi:hypothetical protein